LKVCNMQIVLFTHPSFTQHQSMPRYAQLLLDGMLQRGHSVEVLTAKARIAKLPLPANCKKWLGYIDQFVVFPLEVKLSLKRWNAETLFVFTDHALGPWIPLVKDRKHIIHCHDFLAQQSALGLIPENIPGWSGRLYQAFIRWGYRKGKNFISISKKTEEDLHYFLGGMPVNSVVVYNGLNQSFAPDDVEKVRELLTKQLGIDLSKGYLLHVGGNQFYKNRKGVLELYTAWRKLSDQSLPLLMIGATPTTELDNVRTISPFKVDIYFLDKIEDSSLRLAYQGASLFLFPSLAEGFGWPIAEAMASGCPVLTTDAAPMNEVAGDAAYLIPIKPMEVKVSEIWATNAAPIIEKAILLKNEGKVEFIKRGLDNALRFDPNKMLDEIEAIYSIIML